MLRFGHTADTTNGLDFKALVHAFTQLHKDLCTGTVPAGADSLLHQQEHRSGIILGQVVRQIPLILAHPNADHAVIIGIAHAFQFSFHGTDGFRLTVGKLDQYKRTDGLTQFFVPGSNRLALGISKIQETIIVIADLHAVHQPLIHIEGLGDQTGIDNIHLVNFKILIPLILHCGSTDTDDIPGGESINDGLCLCGVVGMFLVDDDDEFCSCPVCFRNAVKEVLPLAVPDGGIAFLRYQLPVDEGGAFSIEAILEGIKQVLGIAVGCEFAHLLAALFFQITFAGAQPDEGGTAVDLGQIFLDEVDQDDGLTGAGGRFHDDGLLGTAVRYDIQQLDDGLFLKIKQIDVDAAYHVSPTSFSSKLK